MSHGYLQGSWKNEMSGSKRLASLSIWSRNVSLSLKNVLHDESMLSLSGWSTDKSTSLQLGGIQISFIKLR